MVVAAADVPLRSSGSGGAISSSGSSMVRPAFPIAPHEFFRRIPAAPLETTKKAPPPAAEGGDELRLSDLERVCYLGEGACGVVTKVRHRRTGAVFALKTAHYAADTISGAAPADEEAEALLRCADSPHVVRCHAVLAGAYVLELMDAGTLAGVLARRGGRGGFPERALAEVAARCLQGLAHAHSRGVAHLDMRPDNLLANSDGDVKIGDFSVSRILFDDRAGERRRRRVVSVAVGSPMYLSPERFEPDARAGPRGAAAADVWGFGVTVLELFLGRCPFLAPGGVKLPFEKLRQAICDGEPPSAPEASSPELRGFLDACLQKDPRRRATVAQLLEHPFVARRHVEESSRALRELIVETLEDQRSS